MDKIKTGSGKRLRTEALSETALSIPYDAAAMPGASVLRTDGKVFTSVKNSSGVYTWAAVRTSNTLLVNADIDASAAIGLSKLATGALPTGITVSGSNIVNETITNGDISAAAEISVSKLANGSTRQLLQTAADGVSVQWTSNVDIPGTLDVTSLATFDNNVLVKGNLTVEGTTTTVNAETLEVEDKNLVLADTLTPSDAASDGGGITLKGTTDKTLHWINSTDSWTSSENLDIALGKTYRINGSSVLSATALGSSVTSSSLTGVGTLTSGALGTGFTPLVDANIDAAAGIAPSKLGTGALPAGVTVASTNIVNGTIVDADISASAAVSLSKLATGALPAGITISTDNIVDGTITNADINPAASIQLSKLATGALPTGITVASTNIVNGTIVDADISGNAAIGLSKLATGALPTGITVASANIVNGAILDVDISENAAIALSKLATGALPTGITVSGSNIVNGSITNSDISATAEIAASKLANGSARQLLQTAADGVNVQWTSNVDIPGTLDVTSFATFDNNVLVKGNLTVEGTTTTVNAETLDIEDKNIVLADTATPSDAASDGGGITLKGTTDKTLHWINSTDSWTSSENLDIALGKTYRINGSSVLSATALGSSVTSSSLTGVGTLTSGALGTGFTPLVDANIDAAAGIAHSKLAGLAAAHLLLGNASGVPTGTAVSGDIAIDSLGVASIASGVIANSDVSASAAIAGTKITPDFGDQNVVTTGNITASGSLSGATLSISGQSVRTTALQETALPIALDATTMPGASVLGTDGQIYTSAKDPAGVYRWAQGALVDPSYGVRIFVEDNIRPELSGLVLGGKERPEGFPTGPARFVLTPLRDPTPAINGSLGSIDFASRAGISESAAEITTPCRIVGAAEHTLWGEGSRPTSLSISLLDANTTDRTARFRLQYDGSVLFSNALGSSMARFTAAGNLLIGNTTGTERLDVTGNIKASGSLIGDTLSISGQSVRTTALQETALPIALDATTMPGASVLGTDGQIYSSIKIGATYQWSKAPIALSTGELLLGNITSPRDDMLISLFLGGVSFIPSVQIESSSADGSALSLICTGTGSSDEPRILMGKTRGQSGSVQDGDTTAICLFMGHDGTNVVAGAGITTRVAGTPAAGDMPMELYLRTRPQGNIGTERRLTITPDGNVLINNTSGTERLDVTGNIKASGSLIGDTLSISGQSVRTTALQETALPIALDATTMPGASVLGTDGQIYSSIKIGATYQWSKTPAALSTGEIFLGVSEPRTNFNYNLSSGGINFTPAVQTEGGDPDNATISTVRYTTETGPAYFVLGKVNSASPLANTAVTNAQDAGTILFMGADGTELIPGAAITANVTGTVESGSVPMQLNLRTRPEGAVTGTPIIGRLRVTPDGNVLINNTTGTEKLSVTGNIQLTSTADSYKVGTDNVVGARKTGWAAPTGTATRTTFATYAGQDVTDPPTETEVQNIDDHVKILSERLKALIDDLTSHGLIGA